MRASRTWLFALLAAATIVAILPVFVLLPFMRRYLIKGLSLGALK